MAKSVCVICGGMNDPDCPLCGGDSTVEDGEQCVCGEYLDDDGTCPACDTESRGRAIARDSEQRYKRQDLGLED